MHFLVLNMEHWDGHARRLACTFGSIMDMEYKHLVSGLVEHVLFRIQNCFYRALHF